jgi:hypothetical protein
MNKIQSMLDQYKWRSMESTIGLWGIAGTAFFVGTTFGLFANVIVGIALYFHEKECARRSAIHDAWLKSQGLDEASLLRSIYKNSTLFTK